MNLITQNRQDKYLTSLVQYLVCHTFTSISLALVSDDDYRSHARIKRLDIIVRIVKEEKRVVEQTLQKTGERTR